MYGFLRQEYQHQDRCYSHSETPGWSYDSTTGRVRLYGTLNATASNDITINF